MHLLDPLNARLLFKLFLVIVSLSVMIPANVKAQEDDEEDDDDGDGGGAGFDDGNELDGGGFFGMGSNNYEEIPGGIFGGEEDGESMDFMASKRRPSILPSFLSRNKDYDAIVQNNQDSFISHKTKMPLVHFDGPGEEFREDEGRNFNPRHHPRFSAEEVNHGSYGSASSDGRTTSNDDSEEYDPDRRGRYEGYDSSDDAPHKMVQTREEDTLHGKVYRQSLVNNHDFSTEPLSNHEANFDVSQDYDRFPKGSFFGLDGFYGNSKLVHERMFSPFGVKTTSRKLPCDSGCDDEERKK